LSDLGSAPVPPLRVDDHVRGHTDAPLVVFYGDFACPHCALAHARLRGAPLRVVFRHFALRSKHPRALALAHAAEAAARQGSFWQMHDALYDDQGRLDDPHLWDRVRALGLDLERFETDRRSDEVAARVQRDVHDGLRAGAAATPTLYVEGVQYPGPPPIDRVASWSGADTEGHTATADRPAEHQKGTP
jgi:protein-disulfide isomerase